MDPRLQAMQRSVAATGAQQIVMPSVLDDAAALDRDDAVRDRDRGKPMRDDEHGTSLRDPAHIVLDHPLTLVVERARCLVEDEDARIADQRASDRNTLALPA